MHPVFRLLVDDGMRPVDDRVGNLVAPVSRKTVKEQAVLLRQFHQIVVHLLGLKSLFSLFGFILLPHARPDICIDDVGAFDRFSRILDPRIVRISDLL